MKKIYLTIIGVAACVMSSCSGMLDSIQPYLDEGEIIYAGKMGVVMPFVGKNRAELVGFTVYGVNQNKCAITWKNPISLTTETKEFALDPSQHRSKLVPDSLSALLDTALLTGRWAGLEEYAYVFELKDLEEGQHDFSLVLFDPQGNSSIPTLASAYVRGELYEESLFNREMRGLTAVKIDTTSSGDGVMLDAACIRWMITGSMAMVGCNITYDLRDGGEQKVFVPVNDTVTYLWRHLPESTCRYTTLYLPSDIALDTFYAPEQTFLLP
ncbi:MAG: DUF4998 domain-containing protein [Prevotellaceae bacterium]|jgi:hypothetical protein|nr:DUF4998 domain-containing protein [Prevotellaceae bacterium]